MKTVGAMRIEQFRANRSGSSPAIVAKSPSDVLADLERVCELMTNEVTSPVLCHLIGALHFNMKLMGRQMEAVFKEEMDRRFVSLRDGCRDKRLAPDARLRLLELVELRALPRPWTEPSPGQLHYYRHALLPNRQGADRASAVDYVISGRAHSDTSPLFDDTAASQSSNGGARPPVARAQRPHHKQRSDIIIRNADSGKVMGVKGVRVHKIEEFSNTVISFQRVPPCAKERVVQITGAEEANVLRARSLIENVIRRNASPTRQDALQMSLLYPSSVPAPSAQDGSDVSHVTGGFAAVNVSPSASSTCSSSCSSHHVADDSTDMPRTGSADECSWRGTAVGGADWCLSRAPVAVAAESVLSPAGCLGQYRYTVTVGGQAIKVIGPHANLVKTAKLVLDEYFGVMCSLQHGGAPASQTRAPSAPVAITTTATPTSPVSPPKQQHKQKQSVRSAALKIVKPTPVKADSRSNGSGDGVCGPATAAGAGDAAGGGDSVSASEDSAPAEGVTVAGDCELTVTAAGHTTALQTGGCAGRGVFVAKGAPPSLRLTQYDRSSLLMYAKSVVASCPPPDWGRMCQRVPRVARQSARKWDVDKLASDVRGGSGLCASDSEKCPVSATGQTDCPTAN